MINKDTRQAIKGYLEGFIQGMIEEKVSNNFDPKKLRPLRNSSSKGDIKPFHESLLPDGLLKIIEFERSFSTKLGSSFEECAKLIAMDNHSIVERQHRVEGMISNQVIKKIEKIKDEVGSKGMNSTFLMLVEEVVKVSKNQANQNRSTIADLYFENKQGVKFYFEIKSPKPNKGQCLEVLERLLLIHAIESESQIKTFFAMPYNPWGVEKSTYKHSFAKKYSDTENQIIVGKEFWDVIGGVGTYEEILSIYQEVGHDKGPDMLDKLALGY
jgi:hypothetical protein